MSLDYQKLKAKNEEEGSFWTSYSDLFMVLSVVFLLLYVVASLRSGTSSVQSQIENQKIKSENQDLKKQIQAYNALKDDYLEKEASVDEARMYEELMGKLSLLQEEATEEKKNLEAQAAENESKARALNQYQQMVRNIVNTNLLSNKKIKFRNEVIKEKNEDITEKKQIIADSQQKINEQDKEIREKQQILEQRKQEVARLQDEVEQKTESLNETQEKIQNLNANLTGKIKELRETAQKANTSQAVLNRQISAMKLVNAKKISELQNATEGMKEELAQAQAEHEAKMAMMKSDFNNKMNAEREQLEDQLNKEKATASEKATALAEFKNKMAGEKAQLDGELAKLKDEVGKAKGEADAANNKLADAKKEHGRYLAAIDKLQKDKDGLSGDLKRAEEVMNAKKKLAKKVADQLAKNGIKANVDGKNGDVTIQFGEYFDTGRADLKQNMKEILRKFVPTYSKALLEDEKVAKEISSVEIVGFSSPTYKGKYIDPQSLSDDDKAAVAYNLDLSYNRAKSIFSYIFDKKEMSYLHQKELLPLVKVTGRSFLAEEVKGRDIASGLNHKDYCAKYNCEKSQKVIIRFNLKD
ncbi:MAG: hypothetical protein V4598_16670 [Bdellovibrionota bacterium]